MRKLSILLFPFLALSCSEKKEPNPDLTMKFIGVWQSEIQKTARDDIWSTYEINKISNDLVSVNVSQYFDAHQGDYEDYVDKYTFDSVRVEAGNILQISDSRIYGQQKISYDGTGVLAGEKLTLNLIIDYDDRHDNNLFTIPLDRK